MMLQVLCGVQKFCYLVVVLGMNVFCTYDILICLNLFNNVLPVILCTESTFGGVLPDSRETARV